MAERYSDFIWDYYGGRPAASRRTYPGVMPGINFGKPGAGLRAQTLWAMDIGDDNRETGRDIEYFQAMYPEKMRKIQMRVSDLCDTIDYEGSVLYDEYPDRIGLERLCGEIYRQEISEDADEKEAEWVKAAVEVLLYHEICRRRVRRRGMKRKYWQTF
ncbi:MAG: hypothetical protein HFI67_06240 [Lachnospiraceae bacterium]|jgi:hypothetical protein|nr:hypothetical protein [Lachnospiraceae bacterium]